MWHWVLDVRPSCDTPPKDKQVMWRTWYCSAWALCSPWRGRPCSYHWTPQPHTSPCQRNAGSWIQPQSPHSALVQAIPPHSVSMKTETLLYVHVEVHVQVQEVCRRNIILHGFWASYKNQHVKLATRMCRYCTVSSTCTCTHKCRSY